MFGFLGVTDEAGTVALTELASWYNRAFQAVGSDPQYDLTLNTVREEVRRVEALRYQPVYSMDNYNAQALAIRDKYLPTMKALATRSVGVIDLIKSAVTSPFEEDIGPVATRAPVTKSAAETSLLSKLFSGGKPVANEPMQTSNYFNFQTPYADEAAKLGLPYDVFSRLVDQWAATNQMDKTTAAESVLAGRRAEIAAAGSNAATRIKDNPDALHTTQPGTVAVNAKSYDILGMLNALLNASAGGYTEYQRQNLLQKLTTAQIKGQKVNIPAHVLPGGGFQPTSKFPWGWVLLGGAALILGGAFVYKKRKGSSAAAPAVPVAALSAPK